MTEHLELNIEGMTCDSCSNSITTVLSKMNFTSNVKVDWEAGKGELDIENADQRQKVVDTINRLGYKVVE